MKKYNVKPIMKSVLRVLVCVAVVALLTGVGFINTLMFHPKFCKGGYGDSTEGYVDIGTNGVKVAAIVLGPERGRKAILRCHGNAEDAKGTLWALEELSNKGYTVASVDYPGYGLSDGSPDEKGCYRNVHRLYDWLIEKRGGRSRLGGSIPFRTARGDAREAVTDRSVSESEAHRKSEVPCVGDTRD